MNLTASIWPNTERMREEKTDSRRLHNEELNIVVVYGECQNFNRGKPKSGSQDAPKLITISVC